MKKLLTFSVMAITVALIAFTTSTNASAADEGMEFCNGPIGPVAFKMLNNGVYQDSTSAIRFVSSASCGIITYYWKFNASGIVKSSTTNVLRNLTVADTGIPVGNSTVDHWTEHDIFPNPLWTSPVVTQTVTRLN